MIDLIRVLNIEIFGYCAAVLTTLAFLPQLIKTWRTKSAEDVSYFMLSLFLAGVLCWILYGLNIRSFPIVIANSITFILNVFILFLKIKFDSIIHTSK